MITAKLAADQNREVFAIPSTIDNPLSKGCHQLIKQGAKLVENIADILDELQLPMSYSPDQMTDAISTKDVDNTPSVLLKYLSYEAISIDEMVEKSGLSPQIITQELLLLEQEELVSIFLST